MLSLFQKVIGLLGPCIVGVLLLPYSSSNAADVTDVEPAYSAGESLSPGLRVWYYSRDLSRLRDLRDWMKWKDGKEGPPLLSLDYPETTGSVLTATQKDLVGARIEGAILLSEVGQYRFKVLSNDGIQVDIGGKKVLKDDRTHSTRFSKEGTVTVNTPGWYSVYILYFERRHSAALQLHWTTPSINSMHVVPSEAFGH